MLVPAGAAGPGFSLHTQVPVLDCHRSAFTLYFSARDAQGRSLPFATELLRSGSGFSGSGRARPLSLNLGAEGEFDEHGVMPTALIRRDSEIWLYYIGWSRRGDYPYTNNIGLATSADGKRWHKQGRVMFDSESLYTGTLEVVPAADGFLGYYLACDGWLPAEQDIPAEARYCLRIAASENGLKWR
ncbi:MAG: hypothetical protein RL120_03395, partial [Gammaproteobacteria bacterium]